MAKRGFLLLIVFSLIGFHMSAQLPQPLHFKSQPVLEQGIPVEPYALFYENPSGDTAQPFPEVAQQRFITVASISGTKFMNNRQMMQTSQVVWLQFQITNSHPTDTLRLWYGGGPHAYLSLYLKTGNSFYHLAKGGMCTAQVNEPLGQYALPLIVPPQTTNHYFVQVAGLSFAV